MSENDDFVLQYIKIVRGVCKARAFPGELEELEACAWVRIIEKKEKILAACPEKRNAYVRMVAANAVIDHMNKKAPPVFYVLTPEVLHRLSPLFLDLGFSTSAVEKSGIVNREFYGKTEFVNALAAILGKGEKAAYLAGRIVRLSVRRARHRGYAEDAGEPGGFAGNDAAFYEGGHESAGYCDFEVNGSPPADRFDSDTGDGRKFSARAWDDGCCPAHDFPDEGILFSALWNAWESGRLKIREVIVFTFYQYEKADSTRGAAVRCSEVFGLGGAEKVAEIDRKVKKILREWQMVAACEQGGGRNCALEGATGGRNVR